MKQEKANALLGAFQANPEQLESDGLQRSRSSDEVEGLGISRGSDAAVVANCGPTFEQSTEAVHTFARGGVVTRRGTDMQAYSGVNPLELSRVRGGTPCPP